MSLGSWKGLLSRFGKSQNSKPSRKWLEDNTDLAFIDEQMYHDEKFMIQDGDVVGVTGTFRSGHILPTTAKHAPLGYLTIYFTR
jgi:hypothetical protein